MRSPYILDCLCHCYLTYVRNVKERKLNKKYWKVPLNCTLKKLTKKLQTIRYVLIFFMKKTIPISDTVIDNKVSNISNKDKKDGKSSNVHGSKGKVSILKKQSSPNNLMNSQESSKKKRKKSTILQNSKKLCQEKNTIKPSATT